MDKYGLAIGTPASESWRLTGASTKAELDFGIDTGDVRKVGWLALTIPTLASWLSVPLWLG
jgi:hypothetical protein